MKWERRLPDREGYWLRLNAGGRVSLHRVWRDKPKGPLLLNWGWSGESGVSEVKRLAWKVGGFLWWDTGAVEPPDVEQRWIDPEKMSKAENKSPFRKAQKRKPK